MKKQFWTALAAVAGIALSTAGLLLLRRGQAGDGTLSVLFYVCIGVGCGLFGCSVGNLVNDRVYRSHPDLKKQIEIEQGDERNVAIANRAKAKAYDTMLYVFGALMVSLALMQVRLAAVLLLVFAYLLVVGIFIYYLAKYQREM